MGVDIENNIMADACFKNNVLKGTLIMPTFMA